MYSFLQYAHGRDVVSASALLSHAQPFLPPSEKETNSGQSRATNLPSRPHRKQCIRANNIVRSNRGGLFLCLGNRSASISRSKMADLAGTIIGIVSVGTKVALVLSQLAVGMGAAGKEARSIASEIRGLCAVLNTLQHVLLKVETSPYFDHCLELTDDMTNASREMYTDILKITKKLQIMAKTQEGRFKLRSRVYWVAFQKPRILGLRAALEAYKSNLSLMLGTLNIAEKATRPM